MMRRRRRSERGANFVEMALVVPLLMTLMLGIFEVGMMFRSDIAIANATETMHAKPVEPRRKTRVERHSRTATPSTWRWRWGRRRSA